MTDRELMQQALDALEEAQDYTSCPTYSPSMTQQCAIAAVALRARLEQNEFNPDWDAMAVMVEEQQRMAKRIEELEARLAQPEPEPVAWMHIHGSHEDPCFCELTEDEISQGWTQKPLYYTAPPQREWQGLTDEEMFAALVQVDPLTKRLAPGFEYFARAIEAKLKEKNT